MQVRTLHSLSSGSTNTSISIHSSQFIQDIDASMKYLDTDGDGEISFNEFLTWCATSLHAITNGSTAANMILALYKGDESVKPAPCLLSIMAFGIELLTSIEPTGN